MIIISWQLLQGVHVEVPGAGGVVAEEELTEDVLELCL